MPVQLTHPEGASMALSGMLATYLRQRIDRSTPFLLGHWLRVVDDQTLADLRGAVRAFDAGDASASVDDLLSLIFIALSAETQRPDHDVDEQLLMGWAQALRVAVALETYRRRGWLTLGRPLSIQPDSQISMQLTSEGLAHAAQLHLH